MPDVTSQADLGDVQIKTLPPGLGWRYIAYACSVVNQTFSYTAIFQDVQNLLALLPADVKTLNIPLLGTGACHPDPGFIYNLLKRAFEEIGAIKLEGEIYVHAIKLKAELDKQESSELPVKKLVFDYVVHDIRLVQWIKDLQVTDEFFPLKRYQNRL